MKTPSADLAQRLLDVSEQVLDRGPALRLEDVARLVGLLLAVLGRAVTGADPTEPRFRRHLADQLLRGS